MALDYKNTHAGISAELKRLVKVRDSLVASLASVERQIEAVEKARQAFSTVLADTDMQVPLAATETEESEFEILANVRDALKAAGRHFISAPEIMDALISRGWNVQDYDNPLAALRAVLKKLEKSGDAEVQRDNSGRKFYGGGLTQAEREERQARRLAEAEARQVQEQAKKDAQAAIRSALPAACLRVLRAASKPMWGWDICEALIRDGIDLSVYDSPEMAVRHALGRLPGVRAFKLLVKATDRKGDPQGLTRTFYELTDGPPRQ